MNKLMQFGVIVLLSIITHVTDSYAGMGPIKRVLEQIRQQQHPPRPTPRPIPPPIRPQPPRPLPPPVRPPVRPQPPPVRPIPPPINTNEPPAITMMDPSYLGNGCPDGSLISVLSPDQQVISLLFSDFITQAGPGSGVSEDNKHCQIQIPLNILNGSYQVMVTRVDFRGLAALPYGAQMAAIGSYQITSPDYPNIRPQSFSTRTNTIVGPVADEYFFAVEPIETGAAPGTPGAQTKWSACSNRLNLGITSRLVLQNRAMQEDALASVDSIDAVVTPGIEYQIKWRRCR